ncbi:MAG: hypothetical protein LBP68_04065 [Acidobacteriota bacterium]|jgi:hypothetical protein|nr:hypothetical protein [Acidobacteriota bacterium]
MKGALEVLNRMVADGVIRQYAIGGAMGATFYTEPFTTMDLDVFVVFSESAGLLLSLSPIYTWLKEHGYSDMVEECVLIEGTPVQFLPSTPGLLDEAMERAIVFDYDGIPASVFGAEYLLAIAVSVGRPKDRARVPLFLDSGKIDTDVLNSILNRHNLNGRWSTWTAQ